MNAKINEDEVDMSDGVVQYGESQQEMPNIVNGGQHRPLDA